MGSPLEVANVFESGERGRNRTYNLLIKSQLLCQLSYAPELGTKTWRGRCQLPTFFIVPQESAMTSRNVGV